jgi:RNA polymerase sigma factor (sigma-70 family)
VGTEPSSEALVLLGAIKMGDRGAFGSLFDDHAGAIYAFCVRRCQDRDLAEDLMSVVFLEAWRGRSRAIAVDDSLRAWLFGIANNVLRNSARSQRRHHAALARYKSEHGALVQPDLADEVSRAVDRLPSARAVAEALASLSTRERDVVELCLVDELSIPAAATALGIPEGTVKSRLARARSRMQPLLRSGDLTDPNPSIGHVQGGRRTGAPVGQVPARWSQT